LSVPSKGLAIDGDEVRLTQVVNNLLTNAARYTPPGGRVEVVAARERNEIVLRVRDNGIGIDSNLLPHVFEMFVQGARGPDSESGLGLGLSLARTLTTLHGGTLSAHSDGPGCGSEFIVRLPTSIASDLFADVQSQRQPTNPRGRRILVVDDNRDAAEMLAYLLSSAGHEVQLAYEPSQALSLSNTFRPQIAILDIGLPVMDGYMLAREIRARLESATPVLIALTGYGRDQDKRRSDEAGFAVHLVKPIIAEKLLEAIDTIIVQPL